MESVLRLASLSFSLVLQLVERRDANKSTKMEEKALEVYGKCPRSDLIYVTGQKLGDHVFPNISNLLEDVPLCYSSSLFRIRKRGILSEIPTSFDSDP